MDVLCVGQLAADILVRPVDRVDYGVDTKRVEGIDIKNGGDCLNVALGLRKARGLGGVRRAGRATTSWAPTSGGVIDGGGHRRARAARAPREARTCSCLVLINSRGERTFFYYGGANDLFSGAELATSLAGGGRRSCTWAAPTSCRGSTGRARHGCSPPRAQAGKLTSHGRHLGHHGPMAVGDRALSPAPEPLHAEHPGGGEDRRHRRSAGDRRFPPVPRGGHGRWSSWGSRAAT